MPGNELGDGVHNFFAQDNSLQGQPHPQVVEGNWPVLNSNFWTGSQRQVDQLNSNNKTYSQNSDTNRGEGSYPLHVAHGLNFTQSTLRPDLPKSQSLNEQPNLNGFMYRNQFQQTRQNEANFLAVDPDSDQRHLIASRGSSAHELQPGSDANHQAKASVRSETSAPPVSFDLFGGQQQMSHQQSSISQSLQRQQSGINNMQQLQQQLMIRKMQELQRQQQLQQLDLRQHNLIHQVPPFAKQTSGTQSGLVNGAPNSDTSQYPWTAEPGTNWLNRGSPTMQGSPSGLGFPQDHGQTQRLVDLSPQQVDQSLYGVPVSSSRGLPVNQYSQMVADRSNNFLQINQHNLLPEQVGVQVESSISGQKFQNGNMFGLASTQSLDIGVRNIGDLQQVNSMSRNGSQQDFMGKQDLSVRLETSHDKPSRSGASPQNEVALDPTEEKILFGSDDNIWSAFGKEPHMGGEAGSSFDNGGLSNGLSSIQSGSWSALMQSAVAETSSSDIAPQEEWSGLIFHNGGGPSSNQRPSMHNDSGKQEISLADDNMRLPSALTSGSFPPPDDNINTNNVMRSSQLGQKFQNDPGQRLQPEMPQRFFHSLEEAGKWSNNGPPRNSVAEGSQMYRDASQNPLQAEKNAKMDSPSWVPGPAGTMLQSNGWNGLAAIPPGGDRVINNREVEQLQQNSQNSQVRLMQGQVVHGSSLWKSSSGPNSTIETGHVRSRVGSPQANQGILNLKDAAPAVNSSNVGISDETRPSVQNNYLLNQWKNTHPPAKSQAGEILGRPPQYANDPNHVFDSMNGRGKDNVARHEMENCSGKENSNDSHHSNLSQHTSGGLREGGLSDASDSLSLPTGKQKSTNQLSRKVSAPRKFQYHPMGNMDGDVELTYAMKQATRLQAMSPQNAHFGQSKLFDQVPRSSTVMEKGQSSELQKDAKGPDEETSRGNFPGHALNITAPFSRPTETYTSSNVSSSSQNMLELLHKVDQSRNHGAMLQFSPSECNASSQQPEGENLDGVGRLQRSHSSVSQGFGLQLGPPSQRLQSQDPLSSQHERATFNSVDSSNASVEMGDNRQQMVAPHPVQYLPPSEASQVDFKLNRSPILGHSGNENSLYKTPGNFGSALSSGASYSRSNVQNQQRMMASGQMSMNQHIDSSKGNGSYSAQRRSAETLLADASDNFQQDTLASSGGISQHSGLNDVQKRVPTATLPTRESEGSSQHFAMPGISQQGNSPQMLRNMWTNVPAHRQNMGVQFQQVSSHIPESPQRKIVDSSHTLLTQDHVSSQGVDGEGQNLMENSGQRVASANTDPLPNLKNSLGKASNMKNCLDDSPENSQKDIEAFGRSLKPSSFSHQSYSLLKQMHDLKDAESDPSNRVLKRMKGPGADVHEAALKAAQHNDHNAVFGDSLGSSTGVPSEDSRMLKLNKPVDILQRNTSPQGNLTAQDTSVLSQDVSQSNCSDHTTSVRVDHPQVSPQMAPSWFNQYANFKNGQMLQIYDARKATPLRPGEQPFNLGKSSGGLETLNLEEKRTASSFDACQISYSHQNAAPSSVPNGDFSSSQSSQLHVTGQDIVNSKPKKRKSAVFELHSWHKEISDGSKDVWTLSMSGADWNRAANRLSEKIEDEAEMLENGIPMAKSKRRLILTTHLMQQLLPPAPAAILSADASTSYEIMAYAISRIALGDACSAVSCSSNLDVPCDSIDLPLGKGKSSDRNGGRYARTTDELMERVRKLENNFSRLEKSASILDLRVECQDLEKFSVINRFARFHGRGQNDNAEMASTDAGASSQKPTPQRYVTALPMPRSLPDRVQCLSL